MNLKNAFATLAIFSSVFAQASDDVRFSVEKTTEVKAELRDGEVGVIFETYRWAEAGVLALEGKFLVKSKIQYIDLENNELLPIYDVEVIPMAGIRNQKNGQNYVMVNASARVYRDIYSGNNFSTVIMPRGIAIGGQKTLADLNSAGTVESFINLSSNLLGARYTNLRSEGQFLGMELANGEASIGFNWNINESVKIRIEGGASYAVAYGAGVDNDFSNLKARWFSEQKTFARVAAYVSKSLALTFEAGQRGINGNRHTKYVQFGAAWKM